MALARPEHQSWISLLQTCLGYIFRRHMSLPLLKDCNDCSCVLRGAWSTGQSWESFKLPAEGGQKRHNDNVFMNPKQVCSKDRNHALFTVALWSMHWRRVWETAMFRNWANSQCKHLLCYVAQMEVWRLATNSPFPGHIYVPAVFHSSLLLQMINCSSCDSYFFPWIWGFACNFKMGEGLEPPVNTAWWFSK